MRRVLRRHWPLKLAALLIALGLWGLVATGGRTQIQRSVPVEYAALGPDLVLLREGPERLDVQLEVDRWAGRGISDETVRARVNLAGLGEGDRVINLTPAEIQVPAGVRVLRVTPTRLLLTLARAGEATLRVVPQVRGAPADGYALSAVAVDPTSVSVRGPRSTIERRETVETAPVDVTGQQSTVSRTVGLLLPEFVYPVRPGGVKVTVEIRKEHER